MEFKKMQDPRYLSSAQAQAAEIDAGLRTYMLGVYNYMTTGLAVTGFFAYLLKFLSVSTDPVSGQLMLTPIGAALHTFPLNLIVMLAPLGMVFWLSANVASMKAESSRNLLNVGLWT